MERRENFVDNKDIKTFAKLAKECQQQMGNTPPRLHSYAALRTDISTLQTMDLTELLQHPIFLQDFEKQMIRACFIAGNPQAKFVVGAFHFFNDQKYELGKQQLEQAAATGYTHAKYALAIALMCESNGAGKEKLLSLLNEQNGKQAIIQSKGILRHVAFGTSAFKQLDAQSSPQQGPGIGTKKSPIQMETRSLP